MQNTVKDALKIARGELKKARELTAAEKLARTWPMLEGSIGEIESEMEVEPLEFALRRHDDFVFLPGGRGGFAVVAFCTSEILYANKEDQVVMFEAFEKLLNDLVRDGERIPLQLFLRAEPVDLRSYEQRSIQWAEDFSEAAKYLSMARADDYTALLEDIEECPIFSYNYYIVVSYRDDTEEAGTFDASKTEEVLKRRLGIVTNRLRGMDSMKIAVNSRVLSSDEIIDLLFDHYDFSQTEKIEAS